MKNKHANYAEYRSGMKAIYSVNHPKQHKGYPWLESQIPIHERDDIHKELMIRGEYFRPEHRKLSFSDRLDRLAIYRRDCFVCRDAHVDLAMQFKRSVFARHHGIDIFRRGYLNDDFVEEETLNKGDLYDDAEEPSARNIAIIGPSGSGKSQAARMISRLFPQVIVHSNFHGRQHTVKQLNFLRVICPSTSGAKAVWTNFYESFGLALKIKVGLHGLSEAKLQGRIAKDGRLHGISFILIDEMQNILFRRDKAAETLAAFTRLNELAGIPLIYMGTTEVAGFLESEMHSARRVEGVIWKSLSQGEEFDRLLREIFRRSLLGKPWKWTNALSEEIFEFSIGRVDLIAGLILKAEESALKAGREEIKASDLRDAKQLLQMTAKQREEIAAARQAYLEDQKQKEEEARAAAEAAASEGGKGSKKPRKPRRKDEDQEDPEHNL